MSGAVGGRLVSGMEWSHSLPKVARTMSCGTIFPNCREEPEYVAVRSGFFRMRSILIPVEAVDIDEGAEPISPAKWRG